MALDSNAIWDALKARLELHASGFTRISRRRREWSIEEHPVLMILDDSGEEQLITEADDPAPMWRLTGELIVLCRNNDVESPSDDFPASVNALKQSVMEALERKTTDAVGNGWSHYTDLDGLVRVLSVTRVEKGVGDRTGTAVVRINLTLETNAP